MVTANVMIWDRFAGVVLWDEASKTGTFEFDEAFVKSGLDLSPVRMPLEELQRGSRIYNFPALPSETYHGLPGLLADSLPDKFGNALIDAWLARQVRTPESMNPVERLCYIGKRGIGALEYEPSTGETGDSSGSLEIAELVQLAREAISVKQELNTRIEDKDGLLNIIRVGTSAGGPGQKP